MDGKAEKFREAFPLDPILKPRPDLPLFKERMQMELQEDYIQNFDDGTFTVVPKGFITDGASIPKAFWSIIGGPLSRPYLYAAIVHDFCYEVHGNIKSLDYLWQSHARELIENEAKTKKSRILIDLHFREGIMKTPEYTWKVYVMYKAVRILGKRPFLRKDKAAEILNTSIYDYFK